MALPQAPITHELEAGGSWCRTLGELALYLSSDNQAEPVIHGKPVALLAYLGLAPGCRAERDHLAQLFWPRASMPVALHDLRQALYALQQAYGRPLVFRTHTYQIQLRDGIGFDWADGERADAEKDFARAYELLEADFLANFETDGAGELAEWIEVQRCRFRSTWCQVARALAAQYLAEDATERALVIGEVAMARLPFDDWPVRVVMEALTRMECRGQALARYHAYREFLRLEHTGEPGAELRRYARRLEGMRAGSKASL